MTSGAFYSLALHLFLALSSVISASSCGELFSIRPPHWNLRGASTMGKLER